MMMSDRDTGAVVARAWPRAGVAELLLGAASVAQLSGTLEKHRSLAAIQGTQRQQALLTPLNDPGQYPAVGNDLQCGEEREGWWMGLGEARSNRGVNERGHTRTTTSIMRPSALQSARAVDKSRVEDRAPNDVTSLPSVIHGSLAVLQGLTPSRPLVLGER
jgi:hypothetical protein